MLRHCAFSRGLRDGEKGRLVNAEGRGGDRGQEDRVLPAVHRPCRFLRFFAQLGERQRRYHELSRQGYRDLARAGHHGEGVHHLRHCERHGLEHHLRGRGAAAAADRGHRRRALRGVRPHERPLQQRLGALCRHLRRGHDLGGQRERHGRDKGPARRLRHLHKLRGGQPHGADDKGRDGGRPWNRDLHYRGGAAVYLEHLYGDTGAAHHLRSGGAPEHGHELLVRDHLLRHGLHCGRFAAGARHRLRHHPLPQVY